MYTIFQTMLCIPNLADITEVTYRQNEVYHRLSWIWSYNIFCLLMLHFLFCSHLFSGLTQWLASILTEKT